MANGNGKNGNGKKNGNGNKTTKPVKQRRGNGKKKDTTTEKVIKAFVPTETKIANKVLFDKKWRNDFLTGLTFGLYKP